MLEFSYSDKTTINDAYRTILVNLKEYLKKYNIIEELEYSKIILDMLHKGLFSINKSITFSNSFNYLYLPSDISGGVHVMYGICCCRHATSFLYDTLSMLNYNPSLIFYWIDTITGIWHKVNPAIEKANHQVISSSSNSNIIIDPANYFIIEKQDNGEVKELDKTPAYKIHEYQDSSIEVVDKVLRKYYTYKELGIERVYE